MNERDYQRLKKSIEDDYRRKMDALETVWQMVRGINEQSLRAPAPIDSADQPGTTVVAAVEAVLESLPGVFTIKDVEIHLGESAKCPERSSISHALKRMQTDGKLAVVEAGKGKRPTKYRIYQALLRDRVSSDSGHSSAKEMATEEDRIEIIEIMKSTGMKSNEFKEKLQKKYGVERILDLTKQQVNELKEEHKGAVSA